MHGKGRAISNIIPVCRGKRLKNTKCKKVEYVGFHPKRTWVVLVFHMGAVLGFKINDLYNLRNSNFRFYNKSMLGMWKLLGGIFYFYKP